jgi:hypothetical protein
MFRSTSISEALVLTQRLSLLLCLAASLAAEPAPVSPSVSSADLSPSAAADLSPTATPQDLSPNAEAQDQALHGDAVVIRARRLPPQVSERTLKGEEARRVPGAGGDILRALAALPGAVTPNDFLANLLVRGGGFDDNLILLDGVPAPYPFHFGGLESVFHPGLLQDAVFLPGAFDVRFGDTLGGVLDLHTRRPSQGVSGEAGLSLIQASALASVGEGPVRAQGSYRRGWFDLVLPADSSFIGIPRWEDHHAQISAALGGGELNALVFGSRDSLVAKGGPGSSDSRFESAFDAAGLAWRSGPDVWRVEARGAASWADVNIDLGPDLQLRRQPYAFSGAVEADWKPEEHSVNGGLEWQQTNTILRGAFARLPVELGSGVDFNALSRTAIDALGRKAVASAWLQDRWQLMERAAMSLGARYDHIDISSEFHFSPRWSLELGPFWQASTFRFGVGDYFQSPNALETVPGWALGAAHASTVRSYTASLQQGLGPAELRIEAYHKDFEHRIPDTIVPTGVTYNPVVVLNAAGTGWAEGAEALLRLPPVGPLSGWFSYAWSSVIRGNPETGYFDADFSQPHVGNVVLELRLPWSMELGTRWRLASGIPYTPILSRSYDSTAGRWVPTFGATNSARLPPYQRLDLRLEKRWDAPEQAWWRHVTAYLELFNALDAENITSVTYEDDYSDIRRIRQFPRLFFGGVDFAF